MARHALVGCYGTLDRPVVTALPNELVTHVDVVSGQERLGFGIGDVIDRLAELGIYPTEAGLDLLVLASIVHAADTRISRERDAEDKWTREIRLFAPVADVQTWSSCAADLEELLNFLTGDRWTVAFRERGVPRVLAASGQPGAFDVVSLFSGGLDSLIGAIDVLERGKRPLLVSHAGEGATSKAQDDCFSALSDRYKANAPERLRMWLNVPTTLIPGEAVEETTRGRSFLFFALAVFAATGLPARPPILVPENGLISLNVPLDPLRLGSLSTRTTHPFYMAKWNVLLSRLGLALAVENPYWNKTKGEMVAECAGKPLLHDLVASSMSCASAAKARWQGHGSEHCGFCLPCIIRRAAISFGMGNDPTTYTLPDLRAQVLDPRRAQGEQIRSFQVAIARLRARPDLANILIHKPGPLPDDQAKRADLANVYLRGMQEVGSLLDAVRAEST